MNRIAVLSNAGSGRNRSRTELLRLLDTTSGVDHLVTASAEALPEALTTLLGRMPDLVAVNGGDGTVQAVLTAWADLVDAGALPRRVVPIAVLPAGSTNMTAHDLGCGGRMRRRLGDLLALRDRDRGSWRIEARQPLQALDARGVRRLGFFFGMGTIVRGIEYWHERLRHGGGAGEWGAGAALLRAAWGIVRRQPPFHEPARLRLRTGGDGARAGASGGGAPGDDLPGEDLPGPGEGTPRSETEQAVAFLLATTMRRLILGIRPFWGDASAPVALTWVESGARRLLPRLPALLTGQERRLPPEDGYHGLRTDRVELAFDDPWAIDGEIFPATERLVLTAGPAQPFVRLADDLASADAARGAPLVSGSGVDGAMRAAFRARVRREARRAPQAEVLALLDALRDRFGEHFAGAVYYGSCRRSVEIEGLVDLHVLVTDLGAALGPLQGRLCGLLPPNVYYLEVEYEGKTVRCKYAVLGEDQFRRRCMRGAFHSYFWARYAQPVSVVGVDAAHREAFEESLVDALATYFSRVLPAFPDAEDPLELWVGSLALCYSCELRPEGRDRSRALVESDASYYLATAAAALAGRDRVLAANGTRMAAADWGLRAGWGKLVSLARLVKALATFDGGLDYAAWKLERHSGRRIEIPEAVRARPLVRIWPLLWRLWREGSLR